MDRTLILGIDPGAHGAIAVLDEVGGLLQVVDMPSTTEGNGRTATNAPLLASILNGPRPGSLTANLSAPDRLTLGLRLSRLVALAVSSRASSAP